MCLCHPKACLCFWSIVISSGGPCLHLVCRCCFPFSGASGKSRGERRHSASPSSTAYPANQPRDQRRICFPGPDRGIRRRSHSRSTAETGLLAQNGSVVRNTKNIWARGGQKREPFPLVPQQFLTQGVGVNMDIRLFPIAQMSAY